jgi:cell shape-determining protein MreC
MKEFVRNVLRTSGTDRIAKLEAEVAELQDSVEENRRLNERLSDVLDVVTELLVPAVDRDDARLQEALASLQASRQKAT